MQQAGFGLTELALTNPRLAYWYLRTKRKLPQSFNIKVTFQASTPDVPLRGSAPISVGTDFWVSDVQYSVYRPLAFAGSVFKAQSDLANAKMPGVSVSMTTQGGFLNYVPNPDQTPIENLARHCDSPVSNLWYKDWVLSCPESVFAVFMLTKTLADDEVPYEVNLSFKGIVLDCRGFDGMGEEQCSEALRKEFPRAVGA